MSPQPTVVIVYRAQQTEYMYYQMGPLSTIPFLLTQVAGEKSSRTAEKNQKHAIKCTLKQASSRILISLIQALVFKYFPTNFPMADVYFITLKILSRLKVLIKRTSLGTRASFKIFSELVGLLDMIQIRSEGKHPTKSTINQLLT